MHDPEPFVFPHDVDYLLEQIQHTARGERPDPSEVRLEALAAKQLDDHERQFPVEAGVVDTQNGRMIDARQHLGLAQQVVPEHLG